MRLHRIIGIIGFAALLMSCEDGGSYTLYRNSVIDQGMRVHVASFNTGDGEAYNRENCDIAKALFQNQPGVAVKYWCEKGPYRK